MQIKPIFIFSLPRSGSTLLQKLLMTHEQISSVAEPWFLLSLTSILSKEGVLANYSHKACYKAFKDFISSAGGKEVYFKNLRQFVLNLYRSVSTNNELYFLDKTPRYYLIIPIIAEIFPNAKFIFLFRNPLAVYSSIMKAWHGNNLKIHNHYIDLYDGPDCLLQGYKLLKDRSIKINYKDLVKNPDEELSNIYDYLNIENRKIKTNELQGSNLEGSMGDKIGISRYSKISEDSIDKWKKNFNTFYRKKVAKDYINFLDDNYLKLVKIDKQNIIREIQRINVNGLGIKDFFYFSLSNIYRKVKISLQHPEIRKVITRNNNSNIYY